MADGNVMVCFAPRWYQRQVPFMDALYVRLYEKYQITNDINVNDDKMILLRNVYYNVAQDYGEREIFRLADEFDQETLIQEILENDEYEQQSEIITGTIEKLDLEYIDKHLKTCFLIVDIFFKEQLYSGNVENIIEGIILLYEELLTGKTYFDDKDRTFSDEYLSIRQTMVSWFRKIREDNKEL